MCFVAQRDLFLQACLRTEYPSDLQFKKAPLQVNPEVTDVASLCRSLHRWPCSTRGLSPLQNDLPTSPRSSSSSSSSLPRLCARACNCLLAETHGIGEDRLTSVQFAKHLALRMDAKPDVLSVVARRAHPADSGWSAEGSDVAPTGGKDQSQPRVPRLRALSGKPALIRNIYTKHVDFHILTLVEL